MNRILSVLFLLLLAGGQLSAQDFLSKDDAVSYALENNFSIRIAKNNVDVAENNASLLNSGYLPSVSGNVAANYSSTTTNSEYHDGTETKVDGATSISANSSINLRYTIFDGFGRKYNYEKLAEQYNISELQARSIIEGTILNLFANYYEVARLTQNLQNQRETMDISLTRLQRARYGFEYGRNTQLDVLNAEVDYNNDSITYLTLRTQLANTKRNLNVLLGRQVDLAFEVDTTITYQTGLTLDEIMQASLANNVNILESESYIKSAEYTIGISKSQYIPKLDASASYIYNDRTNDTNNPIKHQTLTGPQAGLTLSWNIFDGGATRTRVQNSKILLDNEKIRLEEDRTSVERDVNNAWEFYQNSLFVLQAQSKNLETNQRNFDRTVEQQKLGQITSIVFRQAQINLLRAKLSYSQAKYEAKTAELALLRLSGDLLNAKY